MGQQDIWHDPVQGQAWVDHLAVLHKEGWSFSQIGRRIGVPTNACIGKARRLHLPPRKQEIKLVTLIDDVKLERKGAHKKFKPLPPLPPNLRPTRVVTVEHLCLMWKLDNRTCRYPLWRDRAPFNEQFYCGTPSADLANGKPYCPGHRRICCQ